MRNHIGIPCLVMRGGTSKGPYFKMEDLPADIATRDRVLLAVMGSPDPRRFHEGMATDFLTQIAALASAALSRLLPH